MFTGIVEAVAVVTDIDPGSLAVADPMRWQDDPWQIGESIALNGCCLTLARFDGRLGFDVSEETWSRTALGDLVAGSKVNLERALKAGERFGGHLVQGHVDEQGTFLSRQPLEGSEVLRFRVAEPRYLVDKGSICIDGVSLTIVRPEGGEFEVAAIPHTLGTTTLGALQPGARVNVEYDVIARYVERMLSLR
ncbi:MAG: riboflavin synthase [Armatimonadetes bacterium]|nr:riboflavin synthase [Armatimonadota bacterium]